MKLQFNKSLISLSIKNPPQISYSISFLFYSTSKPKKPKTPVTVLDYLINEHQFSPEAAVKASSALSYLKKPEKADSILSFLKESGFSKTHIEQVVKKAPRVLSSKLDDTIKPKIKIFQDLGFTATDIAEIISADPGILKRSADNQLRPSILVLKSVLGSNAGVRRALKLSGWFLNHDLEKTMMPNIEFMKHCGVSSSQIVKYVFNCPRFFLHKPENIREKWEMKSKLFRSLGFSDSDIMSVFRRMPQIFASSERKIKAVTELLLGARNVDISYIVNHPQLLLFSIEGRLKPRLRIVEILEKKNMLNKKTGLITICQMMDKKFLERYVLPFQMNSAKLNVASEGSLTI